MRSYYKMPQNAPLTNDTNKQLLLQYREVKEIFWGTLAVLKFAMFTQKLSLF